MRKMQEFIVKDNRIFVGLEDSKKTWKLCVRSEGMIVHQTSMPTKYENLRNYLTHRYPGRIRSGSMTPAGSSSWSGTARSTITTATWELNGSGTARSCSCTSPRASGENELFKRLIRTRIYAD